MKIDGVSRETQARLRQYVEMLHQWQKVKNLVSASSCEEVWERHILNCLQFSFSFPEINYWADMGTGAGLPGLIIAIHLMEREEGKVHLIESNRRKCGFLYEVIRRLHLRAEVYPARIEDVLIHLPRPIEAICARALAPLTKLICLADPLLKEGSLGLFAKSPAVIEEMEQIRSKDLTLNLHNFGDTCIVSVRKNLCVPLS